MRWICLSFSMMMLSACASTPTSTSAVKGDDVSTTRSVPSGGCALYGWTTDAARAFVFYADSKTARYDGPEGTIDLTAEGVFPSVRYTDPSGGLVELRFGASEAMNGGTRYPTARVVTKTAEGWERLRPIAIVQNCAIK